MISPVSAVWRSSRALGPGLESKRALGAARSLALAFGAKVVPMSLLDLLVHSINGPRTDCVLALVDAGNGLAYGAMYRIPEASKPAKLFAERASYAKWSDRIAPLSDCSIVATGRAHDSMRPARHIQSIRIDVPPSRNALTATIENSPARSGSARYDFEPIFLHDPNPPLWSPSG